MDENDNVLDWSRYGKGDFPRAVEEMVKTTSVSITLSNGEVVYEDILDYQIGPNWVAISMKDSVVHFHQTKDITYIKSFIKETHNVV